MSPPNPYITLSRLQVALAPLEYQTLIRRYSARWGGFDLSDAGDDFCQHMPRYRIAVCPFCGHEYTESINTYGLHGWMTFGYESVYGYGRSYYERFRCHHVVAVKDLALVGSKPVFLIASNGFRTDPVFQIIILNFI